MLHRYVYCLLGWLPPDPVPIITSCGQRTITGYLLSIHGPARYLVLLPAAYAVDATNDPQCWWLTMPLNLCALLLLTSYCAHLAMWPLTTPAWLNRWFVGGAEAPSRLYAPLQCGGWLCGFLLLTAVSNLLYITAPVTFPT